MKEFMKNLLNIKCPLCGKKIPAVWMEDYKNVFGCVYCHCDITIEIDKKFEEEFDFSP